jgi:Domain of unknown function (DUF4386)
MRAKARIAGIFYLLNIASGALAMAAAGRAALVFAAICYGVVTLLFYDLFKPVNPRVSLIAAIISFVGCSISILAAFRLVSPAINPLVFFGFYCLLIGWLILRSAYMPRIIGMLLLVGGLCWLTFLSAPLAKLLMPYNMVPAILAEFVLTVWLLVKTVNIADRYQSTFSAN